ncbi:L,D-transpeptidase [Spirulina sp. CCNP1310]|uniref:L,D-transpeptidase n=1 Tax=Spirulina sp. CCNP1310 TaxID=3110249 RepID=UPI002B21A2D3|nr:L,D-transpeptidase [Spirulina sp. CCNP1310]MEA5417735.1 L,D-transpeptidase [Spirulina sp. CCNP1310]
MRIQSWGLLFTVAFWGAMGATPAPAAENFPISLTTVAMTEVPSLGHADRYLPQEDVVHVVLRLGERRVYVYRGDEVQASYPVAIGTSATPTPTGTFEVFQMIENPVWQNPWTGQVTAPGPNSALGVRWIGFNNLPNGIIGFHGTPTVNSIGKAASNGCVRMFNHDVVALFEQIEMGTTVTVVH